MASDWLLRHIKLVEGFKPSAYPDPGYGWKLPTIGWGRTEGVYEGETTNPEVELEWLKMKLDYLSRSIMELVSVDLSGSQLDALISFAYNAGLGAFQRSTLRKKLNAGDLEGAAAEFDRWVHSNGKVMKGLVTRRRLERRHFESWRA